MNRPKLRRFFVVVSHADGGASTVTVRATDATHAAILAKKRHPSTLNWVHGVFKFKMTLDHVRFRAAFSSRK